jgi:hypothetical protein
VIRNLALVLCFVGIWAQSYFGRSTVVDLQRAGCQRGARSYLLNAGAWRDAAAARYQSGDDAIARRYDARADAFLRLAGVRVRATPAEIRAVCVERYPHPSPFG